MPHPRPDRHRIERIRFILGTDNALATAAQQQCSQLFHRQLRTQLKQLLDQYGTMQLDKLTLEVGSISWHAFDTQLSERVLQQLQRHLSALSATVLPAEPQREHALISVPAATRSGGALASIDKIPGGDVSAASWQNARSKTSVLSPAHDLAAQFESYLHSGQLNKPEWLGADDWLLAQWHTTPEVWRPMLARCCVQFRPLQRLLQLYSPATLYHLSHAFSPSTPPLSHSASDTPAPYLSLGALCFFQQHPAQPLPVADGRLTADTVQPELAPWLERLQMAPATPILRQWLHPLFHQPKLHRQLTQSLPSALIDTLRALLEERPDTPQQLSSAVPSVAGNISLERPLVEAKSSQAGQISSSAQSFPSQPIESAAHDTAGHTPIRKPTAGVKANQGEQILPSAQSLPSQPIESAAQAVSADSPAELPQAGLPFKQSTQAKPLISRAQKYAPNAPLAVSNAGLALLWPLLPSLLTRLGLLQKNAFIDHTAQIDAVCWLDWLIWENDVSTLERTSLTRYLCGLPVDKAIDLQRHPSGEQKAEMTRWFDTLSQQLPGLQRCSADDIRAFFLQRPGQLLQQKSRWILQVEADASDALLRQLPWPLDQVLLPWLAYPLALSWPIPRML